MTVLTAEGVSVGYGRINVVHDVDLRVATGEFVGLVGANGAGKSTLLSCLAGPLACRSGSIRLAEEDITAASTRRRLLRGVALIPEGREIFPGMTVEEHLKLAYETTHKRGAGTPYDDVLHGVHELFPRLADRAGQRAGSLSGGEQQMLALARGLVGEPTVLLLDEPSLGLAPMLVKQVMDALRKLNDDGLGILMVEQNLATAFGVCQRAYVLERGRITKSGPVAELREDPEIRDAYLGRPLGITARTLKPARSQPPSDDDQNGSA